MKLQQIGNGIFTKESWVGNEPVSKYIYWTIVFGGGFLILWYCFAMSIGYMSTGSLAGATQFFDNLLMLLLDAPTRVWRDLSSINWI